MLCQVGSKELPICTSHTVEEIRKAAEMIRHESPHDESLVIRIYRYANKKAGIQPRKGHNYSGGVELTDEVIQKEAERAEQGYDLKDLKKKE